MNKKIIVTAASIIALLIVLSIGGHGIFWFFKTSAIKKEVISLISSDKKITAGKISVSGYPFKQKISIENLKFGTINILEEYQIFNDYEINIKDLEAESSLFDNNFEVTKFNQVTFLRGEKTNYIEFPQKPKIRFSFTDSALKNVYYQDQGYKIVSEESEEALYESGGSLVSFSSTIEGKNVRNKITANFKDISGISFFNTDKFKKAKKANPKITNPPIKNKTINDSVPTNNQEQVVPKDTTTAPPKIDEVLEEVPTKKIETKSIKMETKAAPSQHKISNKDGLKNLVLVNPALPEKVYVAQNNEPILPILDLESESREVKKAIAPAADGATKTKAIAAPIEIKVEQDSPDVIKDVAVPTLETEAEPQEKDLVITPPAAATAIKKEEQTPPTAAPATDTTKQVEQAPTAPNIEQNPTSTKTEQEDSGDEQQPIATDTTEEIIDEDEDETKTTTPTQPSPELTNKQHAAFDNNLTKKSVSLEIEYLLSPSPVTKKLQLVSADIFNLELSTPFYKVIIDGTFAIDNDARDNWDLNVKVEKMDNIITYIKTAVASIEGVEVMQPTNILTPKIVKEGVKNSQMPLTESDLKTNKETSSMNEEGSSSEEISQKTAQEVNELLFTEKPRETISSILLELAKKNSDSKDGNAIFKVKTGDSDLMINDTPLNEISKRMLPIVLKLSGELIETF